MIQALPLNHDDTCEKKILVVDDYVSTRRMIVDALHQTGYRWVSEAENGRDALSIMKSQTHDLVISDIMMPCMDGMDRLAPQT